MITLNQIALLRGGKLLFANVNLAFYKKQKIGLIGRNGSGKSSLFALLLGELQADSGEIEIANSAKITHLEQEIPSGNRNCVEYVIDSDTKLRAIEHKLKAAEVQHDGIKIGKIHAEYDEAGGYTAYARAATLLSGLGISAQDQQKTIDQLSGGLRRRLNLARALFVPADILLLDEPTNHLDVESVIWLESFLQNYAGIILLISHDRDFLDNVVNTIVEIDQGKIIAYSGNYSAFEMLKAEKLTLQEKTWEKQQQKVSHMEKFVSRFRYKASKARQAQSRLKAMEKMELVAPVYRALPFTFEFYPIETPHSLLTLEDINFAYAEQIIFQHLNLKIEAGMRVGLLGPNGIGKTTLMKLMIGEQNPISGIREVNKKTRIGYFAQQQLEQLDLEASPLLHLRRIAPDHEELELRKYLGRFNFRDEMAVNKIASFSGGEKARLALALVVWQKPNLLLLDEPTNHLDLEMREALVLALQNYSGALILVSHDRYLLRSTVDNFLVITNKNLLEFDGDLEDYQVWLAKISETSKKIAGTNDLTEKKATPISKNRLAYIEATLQKIEKRLQEITAELITPEIYQVVNQGQLKDLLAEQKKLESEKDQLETEWCQA